MRIISIFLLFLSCFCWQPPFELINATSQLQVSGIPDGASTIQYKLTLVAKKSSSHLSFSTLNLKNGEAKTRVFKKTGPKTFSAEFEKGDTLLILASQIQSSGSGTNSNNPKANLMESECDGEASLTYQFKGKEKFFCIEQIEKLQNMYMP